MMFGLSPKLIGAGIAILFIGVIVFAGYRFVTGMQTKIENLTANNAALTVSNTSLTSTLKNIKQDLAKTEEARNELNNDLRKSREKMKRMAKLFADHNFTNLVSKKPGLIRNRMNKATKKLFKEFEEVSR